MTQTFESGYESTLAIKLDAADTTATLATVPTVTKGRMFLDNGEQREWLSFTGVSGSTITGLTRGLSSTADPATSGTGLTWIAGTKIKLVAMHDQMPDKLEGDDILMSATVYASTAARDSALGADGAATKAYTGIYVTATGLFYNYNLSSNQRESVDAGTTTPNASPTAAGKVEIDTAAQLAAGTATGETGAYIVPTPDLLAAQIQGGSWVYCASTTGSDTYLASLTPALTAYTTGMFLPCKFTTTNTGACSININSLGAKNIKTLDGNDPQTGVIRANGTALLMYDGTNMVIQSSDFATTANKGTAETATLAEVVARTDTARYVTPEGIGAVTQIKMLQSTRVSDAASSVVNLAHGLSQIPKWVSVEAICAQGTSTAFWGGALSSGFWDGTNQGCTYSGTNDGGASIGRVQGNDASNAIAIYTGTSSTDGTETCVISADATNVILTRTKAGTPIASDTIYITLICHT